MALAALLDAGADVDALQQGLRTLNLPPWELAITRTQKRGIAAAHVEVAVHGHAAGAAPLLHAPEPEHESARPRTRRPRTRRPRAPPRRAYPRRSADLRRGGRPIRASQLPDAVKQKSEAVYRRLAEAEASVHGSTLEAVHFHEVGAVDSILDVVGTVYALHLLGIERVICSPLPTGHGFIQCAHGLLPVPAPATVALLRGCPLRPVDVDGELVTPTGAALAATLADAFGGLPGFTVRQAGYGAGRKEFPFPNVVRVIVGDDETAPSEATAVTLIEANIDDQSPQLFEAAMAGLVRGGGAGRFGLAPIQMKKNRPAQISSSASRRSWRRSPG